MLVLDWSSDPPVFPTWTSASGKPSGNGLEFEAFEASLCYYRVL